MKSISSHIRKKHPSKRADSICLSCMITICRSCPKNTHNSHLIVFIPTIEQWIKKYEKHQATENVLLEKQNELIKRVTEIFDSIDALKNSFIKQIQEFRNQASFLPNMDPSLIHALKDYLYNQSGQKPNPTSYTDLQLNTTDFTEWIRDKEEKIALWKKELEDTSLSLNSRLKERIIELLSNLDSEIRINTSINSTERKLSNDSSAISSQTEKNLEQSSSTGKDFRLVSTTSQSSRSSKSHSTFASTKNEKVKQNLEKYASALNNSLKEININVSPTLESGLHLMNPRVWLEGTQIESLKQKLGASLLYSSAITDVTLIYKGPSFLELETLLQSLITLKNLSSLDLSFKVTHKMTLETLKSFGKYFPQFKNLRNLRLDFARWSRIDRACIDNLMSYIVSLPNLTVLSIDFSYSFSIKNHHIERIFSGLSKKRGIEILNLNFSNCRYILGNWVEATIKSSVQAMKDLKELSIEFKECEKMSERAVSTLRKQLESISLYSVQIITK